MELTFKCVNKDPNNKRFNVRLVLGNEVFAISNLPKNMVDGVIKNHLVSVLQRYVNHRWQLIKNYGSFSSPEREAAINRLDYVLKDAHGYSLKKVAQVINERMDDLICIAPGSHSRFFKGQTQLLHDLKEIADEIIQNSKAA
jgi:hypothetical protein